MKQREYRAVFISDVHLGTRVSRPDRLVEFLREIKIRHLYLVGDIVDISAFRRRFYWDKDHNAVIRRILKMVKKKVRVVYIPGNHDREMRDFNGMNFAGIEFKNRAVHVTRQKKRLLVIHGDEFDGVLREQMMFLYTVGDYSYAAAIWLSKWINRVTRWFGIDFSLSKYLKTKVKNVVKFINNFEKLIVYEARKAGVDGVVCGHIHSPDLQVIGDKIYGNCGCWTESCSALVEHLDGSLEVLNL
jgi:UDP-2,3-diacylglucosamine pyrophosphatase LpxH